MPKPAFSLLQRQIESKTKKYITVFLNVRCYNPGKRMLKYKDWCLVGYFVIIVTTHHDQGNS